MPQKFQTLRVAALQIESRLGCPQANHRRAAPFIQEAARQGVRLILLPELFASGYVPNQDIWDAAEATSGGPTVEWLRKMSGDLDLYLGAGLVETDGEDFFNAYVMTGPGGDVVGRAQKANAESYCFKRGQGHHIIDTVFGRLGVGICADNHLVSFLRQMHADSVDLILMPHAWPTPYKEVGLVSQKDREATGAKVEMLASLYACSLGVPVVFVNPTGPMAPMAGVFGRLMRPEVFSLQGGSRIVDSDGTLKGSLGSSEGILIADVTLDPDRKLYREPRHYGGWLHPGSALIRKLLFPLEVILGGVSYRRNRGRRGGKGSL